MPLETSADSPAPLRQISQLVGGYIGKLGAVWVEGEIAQLNRRPGICFLTVRDLEAKFSMNVKCHRSVLDASPIPIAEGARVVLHAKPTFYEPNGAFSLDAREIRPVGEGELLAQLERRRQLLAAEGLFDPALKKRLPLLPRRIGLVTGRGSAAERDVLQIARLRWPDVDFLVHYALMQGNESARAVIEGVRLLDAEESVEVIVIARGGGSVEDLLPFSDEALVRAVFSCSTPVVSAIGHEPDTPILDLVADLRASTPTDAAKRIVPDVREELAGVAGMRERASLAVRAILDRETHGLAGIRSRPVLANPSTMIDAQDVLVAEARLRARRSLGHRLDRGIDEVGHHLSRVRGLSPLSTMARGYNVAQLADGTVIASVSQLTANAEFSLRFTDGNVGVRTLSIDTLSIDTLSIDTLSIGPKEQPHD